MKKTYHIVTRAARESAAVIEQFCQTNGQILLPIVNLIQSANTIVDWSSGYPYSVDAGRGTFYPGVNSNAVFTGDPTAIGSLVKGGSSVTYLSTSEKAQFSSTKGSMSE